jgi:hypothetical protein
MDYGIKLKMDIMPTFMWQEFLHQEFPRLSKTPLRNLAWTADFVLLTECDDHSNDLCDILEGRIDSRFFIQLHKKYFRNDPNDQEKLRIAVTLLQQELLDIFNRSGLQLDEPLPYTFQRRAKANAYAFPLFHTVRRTWGGPRKKIPY